MKAAETALSTSAWHRHNEDGANVPLPQMAFWLLRAFGRKNCWLLHWFGKSAWFRLGYNSIWQQKFWRDTPIVCLQALNSEDSRPSASVPHGLCCLWLHIRCKSLLKPSPVHVVRTCWQLSLMRALCRTKMQPMVQASRGFEQFVHPSDVHNSDISLKGCRIMTIITVICLQ